MDEKSAAHRSEQPPIDIIPEIADSVYELSLNSRVSTEALPYLLAHPLSSVVEIVNAKPLDTLRATQWLGGVLISKESRTTFENFVGGRAASRHIMQLLMEIHSADTPPPPTSVEIMRAKQVETAQDPPPSVLSGVISLAARRSEASSSDANSSELSEKIARIANLYAQGLKISEITQEMEISESYVYQALRKAVKYLESQPDVNPELLTTIRERQEALKKRPRSVPVGADGARLISPPSEKVTRISDLYAQGLPAAEISDQLGGFAPSYVTEAVKRTIKYLQANPELDPDKLALLLERIQRKRGTHPRPASAKTVTTAPSNYLYKVDLLKADEEVVLAKRIEAGVLAQEQLDIADADNRKLDATYRRELEWLAKDSVAAREQMIMANVRLAAKLAHATPRRGMPLDDVMQFAHLGLMRAVEKFDYTKSIKFSTYATIWIKQFIGRGLDDEALTISIPVQNQVFMRKVLSTERRLTQDLKRMPTDEEIADDLEISVNKIRQARLDSRKPLELDRPFAENSDLTRADVYVPDKEAAPIISSAVTQADVRAVLQRALTSKESAILSDHFGLETGRPMPPNALTDKHKLKYGTAGQEIEMILQKLRDSDVGHQISRILGKTSD